MHIASVSLIFFAHLIIVQFSAWSRITMVIQTKQVIAWRSYGNCCDICSQTRRGYFRPKSRHASGFQALRPSRYSSSPRSQKRTWDDRALRVSPSPWSPRSPRALQEQPAVDGGLRVPACRSPVIRPRTTPAAACAPRWRGTLRDRDPQFWAGRPGGPAPRRTPRGEERLTLNAQRLELSINTE